MAEKQSEKLPAYHLKEGEDSDTSQDTEVQARRLSWSSADDSLYPDEKALPLSTDSQSSLAPPPPYEEANPGAFEAPTTAHQEYGIYFKNMSHRDMVFATKAADTPALTTSSSKDKGKGKMKAKEKSLKTPICYVEVSELTRGKPDVTLRGLPDSLELTSPTTDLSKTPKTGPIWGIGRLPKLSRHFRVGLGDPADFITADGEENAQSNRPGEAALPWVEIRNPDVLAHTRYVFAYQHPGEPEPRDYEWRRTRDPSHGVEGGTIKRALTLYSYRLVDVASGEGIAVFLENMFKSARKVGKLRIFAPLDDNFWLMVVLSCSALLEKARRRGGGGGGGG